MNRTTKNVLTAFCCTAMLTAFGCSPQGELSVLGMYDSQGQALAGDRCDELLMDAADANSAEDQEHAREAYRACVEEALHEDGRNGECRDRDDRTCDVILDEIGDTLHRLREESGQTDAPRCDAPQTNGEVALCHLIAAYEACELDRDNDGDPDIEPCPDGSAECNRPPAPGCSDDQNCEPGRDCTTNGSEGCPPPPTCTTEDGRECEPQPGDCTADGQNCPPPQCDPADSNCGTTGGGCDPDDPNTDCAPAPEDCTTPDGERCEENGDTTPPSEGGGATDEFCAHLLDELQRANSEEEAHDLREIYERECVN